MTDMSMSDWFIRTQKYIDEANEQSRAIRTIKTMASYPEYLTMEIDYMVSDMTSDLISSSGRLHRLIIAQRLYLRKHEEVSDD